MISCMYVTPVFASDPSGPVSKKVEEIAMEVEDIAMEVEDTMPCPATVSADSFNASVEMEKSKAAAKKKLKHLSDMVSGIKLGDVEVAKRLAKIASDIKDVIFDADEDTLVPFVLAKIEEIEADIKAVLANL